ncbi:MAG: peptide ABC transporter substrate-binding protein [Chloroflexota bacterium]
MIPRKYAALAVGMLLLPTLAACGGEAATATPPAPAATNTTGTSTEAPTATTGAVETAPTATTSTSTGGGTAGGDKFSWRAYAEPAALDPALMEENLSIDIGQNFYDALIEFDPQTQELKPALAAALPEVSADGTVYTFKLRPEAKFSNGDPVTSADVLYSWNRVAALPEAPYADYVMSDIKGYTEVRASVTSTDTTATKLTTVSGIEAPDAQTVKVTLKNPSAYFLSQMAVWTYYVVNQKQVEKGGAEWFVGPGGGTGAYILSEWKHDQSLSLKVNPNYWGPKATVDVEVPIIKDTTTAQAQYESGTLATLDGPSPADLDRIKGDAKLKDQLHSVGQARAVWLGLNMLKGPFSPQNDETALKLRQAFAYSVDREQLVDLAVSGAGQPLTNFMPEGEPGFKKVDVYPFDPEKGKALLAETGHPGCQGLDLVYTYRQRDVEQKVAEQLQAQWKELLGCDIKIEGVEWKDMLAARQDHQYIMFYDSWGHDYPDPQNWFFPKLHSSQIKGIGSGIGNDPGFSDPQFDKLVDDANKLADPTKLQERYAMYQQAEEIMLKTAAEIPLYQATRYWLVSPKWNGYAANNSFAYPFRLVTPAK